MWLMMAIEQPAITAVIARLPEPELNLAAFGVTFSLALIVESPIIQLLTAGTALPKGKQSYERLLRFTHIHQQRRMVRGPDGSQDLPGRGFRLRVPVRVEDMVQRPRRQELAHRPLPFEFRPPQSRRFRFPQQ